MLCSWEHTSQRSTQAEEHISQRSTQESEEHTRVRGAHNTLESNPAITKATMIFCQGNRDFVISESNLEHFEIKVTQFRWTGRSLQSFHQLEIWMENDGRQKCWKGIPFPLFPPFPFFVTASSELLSKPPFLFFFSFSTLFFFFRTSLKSFPPPVCSNLLFLLFSPCFHFPPVFLLFFSSPSVVISFSKLLLKVSSSSVQQV